MPNDANVVLTGFMGTGKTTVGRLLADRLGFEFVDTDQLIEQRHGPIPLIFREHGEGEFRRLERAGRRRTRRPQPARDLDGWSAPARRRQRRPSWVVPATCSA